MYLTKEDLEFIKVVLLDKSEDIGIEASFGLHTNKQEQALWKQQTDVLHIVTRVEDNINAI